ncbi:pancreatic lipase-related protein 2-like [Aricia agestis]|uniref:pancreatic lipase-related protein 2-like n=1 Tax=Aricia agestis TaxID=91739 RepID=UPI001C201729|nr:pancreatic lipase-related protein 2-like [Aricia agestis]
MMLLLIVMLMYKEIVAMESSRAIEGYPKGYMSDCPGSTKPAIITKKSLRQLAFVNGNFNGTERKYNYYEMGDLAKDPYFDFNKTTLVYVSGFLDSPHFLFSRLVADAYNNLGYNILNLDTNKFTTLEYQLACRMSRPVGKHVAEMLANLTRVGLDPKKLQLLGLSLGGQTISFIAKEYKKLTGSKVARVTGLDPAGPCFRNLGPEDRIDSSDADFVDIISTNIDGFGMAAPVAHVQFYVNGGEFQPGGPILWYNCGIVCSHIYSFAIWLSAIRNPSSFIGIQCDSVQQARDNSCYGRYPLVTNVMGLNTDRRRKGIFYLATGQFPPYYLGPKGLKRKNDFVLKKLSAPNDVDVFVI